MRIKEIRSPWKEPFDWPTNSPCQHLRNGIKNSLESMQTDVRVKPSHYLTILHSHLILLVSSFFHEKVTNFSSTIFSCWASQASMEGYSKELWKWYFTFQWGDWQGETWKNHFWRRCQKTYSEQVHSSCYLSFNFMDLVEEFFFRSVYFFTACKVVIE